MRTPDACNSRAGKKTLANPLDLSRCDALWTQARLETMVPLAGNPYGTIDDGAIAVAGGRIHWVGPQSSLPADIPAAVSVHSAGTIFAFVPLCMIVRLNIGDILP